MAYFNQTNYNSPRGQNEQQANVNRQRQPDINNQANYQSPRGNYDQNQGNYQSPRGNYDQNQTNYLSPRGNYEQNQQPPYNNAPVQYGHQQRYAQYDTRQPQQFNAPENQYTDKKLECPNRHDKYRQRMQYQQQQPYQGDPQSGGGQQYQYGGGPPQISLRYQDDRYGRERQQLQQIQGDPYASRIPYNYQTSYNKEFDQQRFRKAPEKERYDEKSKDVQVIKNPKCGWYVFVRFHRNGFDELKDSLSRTRTSTLRIHGGRVTGIALAEQVHVIEGTDNWVLQTKFTRRGETWFRQQQNEKNDMCILVMGFHSYNELESWIKRDNNFKQHDFPAQYGYEAFAAALNYIPADDKECLTYLLTEYANVKDSDADAFREYAYEYTKVLERYCPMPYVIKTFGSQHIKGTWIKPRSIVTLSLFPSSRHVKAFYEDPDYKKLRFDQDRIAKTTSICFTLNEFV